MLPCCSTALANRAQSAARPSCNARGTSSLDVGTPCLAPPAQPRAHHVLNWQLTSLTLPMRRPFANGAGHTRAQTYDGAKSFAAVP